MGGFGRWEFLALGTVFSHSMCESELRKLLAKELCIVLVQHPAVRVTKL